MLFKEIMKMPQGNLSLTGHESLKNADRLTTYRQICAQVGREFNLHACFMTKPFMGVSASGCHHNISLWKDGDKEEKILGQKTRAAMDEVLLI